jgi:DNA-binding HxlR family transcriptional regulator/putative sterol carrier protein
MRRRSYNQFCATARTLDVIGERWTLLVIRELITGPKRYKDLLESLPGIGSSLLAARLKHLEAADLIRRVELRPPAGSKVYELTEAGRDLEPVVMAVARWGLKWALNEPRPGDSFRSSWAVLAMEAAYDERAASGVEEIYEFRVGDEIFHARVHNGAVQARHGPAFEPDLTITATPEAFVDLAAGRATLAQATKQGWIEVDGSRAALRHCSAIFKRPQPVVQAAA